MIIAYNKVLNIPTLSDHMSIFLETNYYFETKKNRIWIFWVSSLE